MIWLYKDTGNINRKPRYGRPRVLTCKYIMHSIDWCWEFVYAYVHYWIFFNFNNGVSLINQVGGWSMVNICMHVKSCAYIIVYTLKLASLLRCITFLNFSY